MVYCAKCGEQNEEGMEFCKKCGAPLGARTTRRIYRREKEQCFGVPMAGYTWGLLIGLVIVIWGASELINLNFEFFAVFAVIFGALILWNALRRTQGG